MFTREAGCDLVTASLAYLDLVLGCQSVLSKHCLIDTCRSIPTTGPEERKERECPVRLPLANISKNS